MRRIFKKLDTPVSDLMDIAAASVLVIRELKVKGGPPPELPSAEAEAWALFGRDIDVARFELDQARRGGTAAHRALQMWKEGSLISPPTLGPRESGERC
jgi:hypothetical protein